MGCCRGLGQSATGIAKLRYVSGGKNFHSGMKKTCTFKNGKYEYPVEYDAKLEHNFMMMMKWMVQKIKSPSRVMPTMKELPIVKPNFFVKGKRKKEEKSGELEKVKMHSTWIGHSTYLLQLDAYDVNIITDPMFSQRASPFQFAGPKRYRDVPCGVKDLPKVDYVVISHNHYDHMDENSCKQLYDLFQPKFFVPKGLKAWFVKYINQSIDIQEMNWWEEVTISHSKDVDVKIVCLPCQHWSRRGLSDTNHALWCSWGFVVSEKNKKESKKMGNELCKLYFAGDTGYNKKIFEAIGKHFGSGGREIDASVIPIGAYNPQFIMKQAHVTPEEAIDLSVDIKSNGLNFPCHFGTFALTGEPYLEPLQRLEKSLKEKKLDPDHFVVFKHGETKIFDVRTKGTLTGSLKTTDLQDNMKTPSLNDRDSLATSLKSSLKTPSLQNSLKTPSFSDSLKSVGSTPKTPGTTDSPKTPKFNVEKEKLKELIQDKE